MVRWMCEKWHQSKAHADVNGLGTGPARTAGDELELLHGSSIRVRRLQVEEEEEVVPVLLPLLPSPVIDGGHGVDNVACRGCSCLLCVLDEIARDVEELAWWRVTGH